MGVGERGYRGGIGGGAILLYEILIGFCHPVFQNLILIPDKTNKCYFQAKPGLRTFPHNPILHYACRALLTESNGKNNSTVVGLCAFFVVFWWCDKGIHILSRMPHNKVWGYMEI